MKRRMKRFLTEAASLLLILTLLCGAGIPVSAAEDDLYPDIDHVPVEIDWNTDVPSPDRMTSYGDDLRALADGEENSGKAKDLYDTMLSELDAVATAYTIIDIEACRDVNDEAAEKRSSDAYDAYIEAYDILMTALHDVIDLPGGKEILETLSDEDAEDIRTYEPFTDEEKEFMLKEKELASEYDRAMAQEIEVRVGGKTYTDQDLSELSEGDYDLYLEVLTEIEKKENENTGDIYLEILEMHDKQAKDEGYENYAEYANEEVYFRDYTEEDLAAFCGYVKEHLIPVSEDLSYQLYYDEPEYDSFSDFDQEEMLDRIGPYIGAIDPRLSEAWDYMG